MEKLPTFGCKTEAQAKTKNEQHVVHFWFFRKVKECDSR